MRTQRFKANIHEICSFKAILGIVTSRDSSVRDVRYAVYMLQVQRELLAFTVERVEREAFTCAQRVEFGLHACELRGDRVQFGLQHAHRRHRHISRVAQ